MTAHPVAIGTVSHYNLLEKLEPAGPGDLYRARDTRLGRTVTVRVLPPDFIPDPAARRSLLEKARLLISLSHPNVTTLFDAGEHDGSVFLAFEFLQGQSLRREMAGRPMNVLRAVELGVQVADAVADAHATGFLHGGLSPDSIVITSKGHAKIPVFELAARVGFNQDSEELRLRDYDSPEEAGGGPVDERSDVYSVGAILYEALTTRRPMHRGAAAPSASNAHVPAELDAVVLKAVAPNRDTRYQSAATLAAELRRIATALEVHGGAGDESADVPHAAPTMSRIALTAGAILVALAAIIWWLV